MVNRVFYCLVLAILAVPVSYSQDASPEYASPAILPPVQLDKLSAGLGGGLDYGGFGVNLLGYPQQNIGIFAGVGYALAGVGVNGGIKARLLTEKTRINPFLMGMYGYNTAIAVVNREDLNKLFYGPSFGIGIDIGPRPGKIGYLSVAILIPVRSSEVKEYIEDLEDNYGAEFAIGLLPIAFSIGYRFIIL